MGWGHCLVAAEGQDQSLSLCTPVPGVTGVSEPFVGPQETMVGFGLSVLAVGALSPSVRAHFKQAPAPKVILGPGTCRFPFQSCTPPHLCCMSPSPSEPPAATGGVPGRVFSWFGTPSS